MRFDMNMLYLSICWPMAAANIAGPAVLCGGLCALGTKWLGIGVFSMNSIVLADLIIFFISF